MKISEKFLGNYFKAADLPQPRVLSIESVVEEPMPDGDSKPVMKFIGEQQRLVLNKTNAFECIDLFGDETAAWSGQQVELFATTTSFSGRIVPCIRLRQPATIHAVPTPAAPAPQPVPQAASMAPIQAPDADYPVDA